MWTAGGRVLGAETDQVWLEFRGAWSGVAQAEAGARSHQVFLAVLKILFFFLRAVGSL